MMNFKKDKLPPASLLSEEGGSLFLQIADYYRRQILNHEVKAGSKLPSCQSAAATFGVTADTVNRAYNVLAREALVGRRRSVGTVVLAQQEKTEPPLSVQPPSGVLTEPIVLMASLPADGMASTFEFFSEYLKGMTEAFNIWNHRLELVRIPEGETDLSTLRYILEKRRISGLMSLRISREATDYAISKQLPTVLVDSHPGNRKITSVATDIVHGYHKAWEAVDAAGHRNALYLGCTNCYENRSRQCEAGRELSGATGRLLWNIKLEREEDPAEIWAALSRTLGASFSRENWPTLIFTQTDKMAAALIRALVSHGIRVPDDVSVIGFDNSVLSRRFMPSISTIAKDRYRVGLAAASLMVDLLANRKSAQGALQIIPTTFIPRESFIPLS